MMNVLRLLPVILAFGLLAAHFSRADMFPAVIVSLAIPFLLLIRKPWIARSIQVLLLLGAAEWIRAMFGYINVRKEIGEDWGRLAIILVTADLQQKVFCVAWSASEKTEVSPADRHSGSVQQDLFATRDCRGNARSPGGYDLHPHFS